MVHVMQQRQIQPQYQLEATFAMSSMKKDYDQALATLHEFTKRVIRWSHLLFWIRILLTRLTWLIHTSDFTLKMESVSKNTIFGPKMMVKSGLEKIFLKFLHAGDYFPLLHKSAQNKRFSNKNNYLPSWRDFKRFFF